MKRNTLLKFILWCGLLTMISACGSLTQSGQKNISSGNGAAGDNKTTAVGDSKTTGGDARSELLKAMRNLLAVPSYRNSAAITNSEGDDYKMTMDYAAPDRYYYSQNGKVAGIGERNSEGIFIGEDGWTKMGDKPWAKSSVKINMAKAIQKQENFDELTDDKTAEVKSLGTESLDGVEMKVYQYSQVKKDEDETIKSTGKIWVGASDNLPHKMEGKTESTESGYSDTGNITATYDYSASVKIEPPM